MSLRTSSSEPSLRHVPERPEGRRSSQRWNPDHSMITETDSVNRKHPTEQDASFYLYAGDGNRHRKSDKSDKSESASIELQGKNTCYHFQINGEAMFKGGNIRERRKNRPRRFGSSATSTVAISTDHVSAVVEGRGPYLVQKIKSTFRRCE